MRLLLLLLACAGAPPPGQGRLVEGRLTLPSLELELLLPAEGRWTASPADLASGLDQVVLEGHLQGVDLALTAHLPRPAVQPRLDGAGALDRFLLLAPQPADPAPLQRLAHCRGAVEQALPGLVRVAWASGEGVVVLNAWGTDQARRVARSLACGEAG